VAMENSLEIQRLIGAFQTIGRRVPVWTQAQGSNLSYKDTSDMRMYIKPSGFRLDQVRSVEDLVVLDLNTLNIGMAPLYKGEKGQAAEEIYAKTINNSKVNPLLSHRPSMETGFHLALQKKYVFHFHALSAVVMGALFDEVPDKISDFLSRNTNLSVAFIEYATPGLELTQALKPFAQTNVLILKNHGVILNSDHLSIIEVWEKIENAFCDEFLLDRKLVLSSLESLEEESNEPVPIKILFPDFAVFFKKLKPCLKSKEGGAEGFWYFDPMLKTKEKDLYEIWLSYWLLKTTNIAIQPLEEIEVQKLCGLPTEQYRMMIKK